MKTTPFDMKLTSVLVLTLIGISIVVAWKRTSVRPEQPVAATVDTKPTKSPFEVTEAALNKFGLTQSNSVKITVK